MKRILRVLNWLRTSDAERAMKGASAGGGRVDETHRPLVPTLTGTNERRTPASWILVR